MEQPKRVKIGAVCPKCKIFYKDYESHKMNHIEHLRKIKEDREAKHTGILRSSTLWMLNTPPNHTL